MRTGAEPFLEPGQVRCLRQSSSSQVVPAPGWTWCQSVMGIDSCNSIQRHSFSRLLPFSEEVTHMPTRLLPNVYPANHRDEFYCRGSHEPVRHSIYQHVSSDDGFAGVEYGPQSLFSSRPCRKRIGKNCHTFFVCSIDGRAVLVQFVFVSKMCLDLFDWWIQIECTVYKIVVSFAICTLCMYVCIYLSSYVRFTSFYAVLLTYVYTICIDGMLLLT